MNDARYQINAPAVVSDIIDGEAVIMDLKSGNYFSTAGTGAVVWSWLIDGHAVADVVSTLAPHAKSGDVEAEIRAFVDELVQHDLIRAREEPETKAQGEIEWTSTDGYAAPSLSVYTDMQDLLLLDPIHDVDEIGWPAPKSAQEN